MAKLLLYYGSVGLLVLCLAFARAASAQARRPGRTERDESAARARAVGRLRLLSRRAGALAVVLMLASKCAQ